MSTVDPPGTADDLRWQAAKRERNLETSMTRSIASADRGVAALGVAHRELSRAVEALDQHGGRSSVAEPVALASEAFARSKRNLADVRAALRSVESVSFQDESIESLMSRLSHLLESPEVEALEELAVLLENNRTSIGAGWRESLPDLALQTGTARGVFQELSVRLVACLGDTAELSREEIRRFQNQSRSDRVASFLSDFRVSPFQRRSHNRRICGGPRLMKIAHRLGGVR